MKSPRNSSDQPFAYQGNHENASSYSFFVYYILDLWTPFGKSSSFQSRFVLLVFLSASLGLGRPKKCIYIYIYIRISTHTLRFSFLSETTYTPSMHCSVSCTNHQPPTPNQTHYLFCRWVKTLPGEYCELDGPVSNPSTWVVPPLSLDPNGIGGPLPQYTPMVSQCVTQAHLRMSSRMPISQRAGTGGPTSHIPRHLPLGSHTLAPCLAALWWAIPAHTRGAARFARVLLAASRQLSGVPPPAPNHVPWRMGAHI